MTTETKLKLLNDFMRDTDYSALLLIKDAMEEELRVAVNKQSGKLAIAKSMQKAVKLAERKDMQKPFRSESGLICAVNNYYGIFTKLNVDLDLGQSSMDIEKLLEDLEGNEIEAPLLADVMLKYKLARAEGRKPYLYEHAGKYYNPQYLITVLQALKDPKAGSVDSPFTPIYLYDQDTIAIVFPVRVPKTKVIVK